MVAISSAAAFAADLPARTYTKAPMVEPAWNWTGFYAGVNVGYGVTHSPTINTVAPAGLPALTFNGNTADLSAAGVVGGAQIGYNWQFAPMWLLGVEADFQGADQHGKTSANDTFFLGAGNFNAVESRLNYFGTVRARLGWLPTQSTLIYVTGGLAYGETETTLSSNFVVAGGNINNVVVRNTDTGWTAGGGIETRLLGNWTAKAEYLYLDLGDNGTNYVNAGNRHTGNVEFRDHIARAGLNYKFGNY